MSVDKIIRFVKGYVVICAEGHFCERFLNICMRRGIYLSDVRRLGEERIRACISIAAFREIREIAGKTKTHVTITARYGLPFVLHRYRKRKAVFVGITLFLGILWYLTGHIMGIDIVGNERIPTSELLAGLSEFGVYQGADVDDIDSISVKNRMMTKFDDIAWIGVSVKGSRVFVEIKERLDTPVRTDTDVPCDIVAERDGIIRLAEVKEGQLVVKTNQFVEKGDLLVSGVMDSEAKGIRFVHAFGQIHAETVYTKTDEYPFEYGKKVYTGNEKSRYTVSIMGNSLNLFFKDNKPFEKCEVVEKTKEYKAPFSFIPSVFIKNKVFREFRTEKNRGTVEETVKRGERDLLARLIRELPSDAKVIGQNVTYTELEKGLQVTLEFVCKEDIGGQRIIDKTELLGYDRIEEK